jgi:hypothetical protein
VCGHRLGASQVPHLRGIPHAQLLPQQAAQIGPHPCRTGRAAHIELQEAAVVAAGDLRHPHRRAHVTLQRVAHFSEDAHQHVQGGAFVTHQPPAAGVRAQRVPHPRPRQWLARLETTRLTQIVQPGDEHQHPTRLAGTQPEP